MQSMAMGIHPCTGQLGGPTPRWRKRLLLRGAKGDAKNKFGSTPDKLAWQQGNYGIRHLLSEHQGRKKACPSTSSAWRVPGEIGVISVECQKCKHIGYIRGRFPDSAYEKGMIVICDKCGHRTHVEASIFSG